ncbi:hypothetical protein ACVDG5_016495 [Mesorhizobium sp. ORM6]
MKMRVDRINVYTAQLPVKGGTYRMASDDVKSLDSTLVEIVADDGLAGWGETCPIGPVYQPHHALERARRSPKSPRGSSVPRSPRSDFWPDRWTSA